MIERIAEQSCFSAEIISFGRRNFIGLPGTNILIQGSTCRQSSSAVDIHYPIGKSFRKRYR